MRQRVVYEAPRPLNGSFRRLRRAEHPDDLSIRRDSSERPMTATASGRGGRNVVVGVMRDRVGATSICRRWQALPPAPPARGRMERRISHRSESPRRSHRQRQSRTTTIATTSHLQARRLTIRPLSTSQNRRLSAGPPHRDVHNCALCTQGNGYVQNPSPMVDGMLDGIG